MFPKLLQRLILMLKRNEYNAKAKHAFLSGFFDTEFVKFMHCKFAKQTWDKLQNICEGDENVKEAKLQNLRALFEGLKMREDEKIVDYLLRVDEIVNVVRGLGEDIDDNVIVKKVIRSLTSSYDTKFSTIEEARDLNNFMDELFGSLSTYEMRIESVEPSKREVSFNLVKKGKEATANVDQEDPDNAEANFVRRDQESTRTIYPLSVLIVTRLDILLLSVLMRRRKKKLKKLKV